MEKLIDSKEMLEYLPESGQILSTLRNHLISVLGMDRAKGFLLRYGWDCGQNFSNHIKKKDSYHLFSLEDLFKIGSQIHGSTANIGISVTKLIIDPKTMEYYSEGYWEHSQEAEKHIETFGFAEEPVCFTLTGFAGGYVSNILGKQVIFQEIECRAKGDRHCRWIAKPVDDWGLEIEKELQYYQEEKLGQALDQAIERIEEQNQVFKKALQIGEKLSNTVLKGNGLHGVIKLIEKEMNYPVILEDVHLNPLEAQPSFERDSLQSNYLKMELKPIIHSTFPSKKTIHLKIPTEEKGMIQQLTSPIFIKDKLYGFISFIKKTGNFSELDYLIIERASSVCAIQILNETSAFEHEQRIKGELLSEILQRDFPKEDFIYRLRLLGYNIVQPQYVFVFDLDKNDKNNFMDDQYLEFKKTSVQHLYQLIERQECNSLISTRVNQIIALIPEEFVQPFPSLLACGTWIWDQVFAHEDDIIVTLGISTICLKVEDLKKGMQEAEKTVNIMKYSKGHVKVKSFYELGAIAKFLRTDHVEEMEIFAHQLLDKIKAYDEKYHSDLLKTLYWYGENNGHLKNTANDMKVSLGSVRYRLNRIQEMGGFDLSTSQGFFDAYVAVQIFLLLGVIEIF